MSHHELSSPPSMKIVRMKLCNASAAIFKSDIESVSGLTSPGLVLSTFHRKGSQRRAVQRRDPSCTCLIALDFLLRTGAGVLDSDFRAMARRRRRCLYTQVRDQVCDWYDSLGIAPILARGCVFVHGFGR